MLQWCLPHLASRRLVLASASPRRRQILADLGLNVEVVASQFEENLDKTTLGPVPYVLATARGKALEVHDRLRTGGQSVDLIISADTIVVLNEQILEKPSSEAHARQMLQQLSGNTHTVHTAVVLVLPNKHSSSAGDAIEKDRGEQPRPFVHSFHETTQVTFAQLNEVIIDGYVATGSPMDKAGSYGIQEATGGSLIQSIHGCYYNVVGFPLNRFCTEISTLIKQDLL